MSRPFLPSACTPTFLSLHQTPGGSGRALEQAGWRKGSFVSPTASVLFLGRLALVLELKQSAQAMPKRAQRGKDRLGRGQGEGVDGCAADAIWLSQIHPPHPPIPPTQGHDSPPQPEGKASGSVPQFPQRHCCMAAELGERHSFALRNAKPLGPGVSRAQCLFSSPPHSCPKSGVLPLAGEETGLWWG